jgi:phage I-like protein
MTFPTNAVLLSIGPLRANDGWVDIARTGDWVHPQRGPFTLTPETFESWVRNVVGYGNRVKFDYDHNTVFGEPVPESQKASGYIEPRADNFRIIHHPDSDGSMVLQAVVNWTDEARGRIDRGEYWGVSPVFVDDWPDPRTGKSMGPTLLNLALTSEPFLAGMAPLAATRQSGVRPKEMEMDEKAIRAALGIGDEVDIIASIHALKATGEAASAEMAEVAPVIAAMKSAGLDAAKAAEMLTKAKAIPDPVLLSRTEATELRGSVSTLKTELSTAREDLDQIKQQRHAERRETAISGLVACMRIAPAHRTFASKQFDLGDDHFNAYLATLPPAQTLARIGTGLVPEEGPEDVLELVKAAAKVYVDGGMKPAAAEIHVLNTNAALKERYDRFQAIARARALGIVV